VVARPQKMFVKRESSIKVIKKIQ